MPSVVQKKSATFASMTAHALAFDSNVKANTLIVVGFVWAGPGAQTTVVTDTLTNSWSNRGRVVISGGQFTVCEVFYCKSNGAGANTITATTNTATPGNIHIWEISGNSVVTLLDPAPQLQGGTLTNQTTYSANFTPLKERAIVFSLWGDAEQTMPSITPPSWDDFTTELSGTSCSSSMAVKLNAGLPEPLAVAWTWGTTDDSWNILTNAFRSGINFDAKSDSGYNAATAAPSWTHVNAGNFLRVRVSLLSVPGTTVTGVTYGGVAMDFIGAQSTVTGAGRVESWGMVAPPLGSNTVAVTLSAVCVSTSGAVSYYGVNQDIPTQSYNSAQATNVGAADATVNITPITNGCWVCADVATDDGSITGNQTERNNVSGAGGSGADEDTGPVSPAASTTVSFTGVGAGATWAIGGFAIRPLTAGTNSLIFPRPINPALIVR